MKRVTMLAAALAFAVPSTAGAADPVLAEASHLAGFVTIVGSGAPGMLLAAVRDDQSLVVGYGETERATVTRPTETASCR